MEKFISIIVQTQFLEDLIQIIRDVLIFMANDSTGDAEIRGFKNIGSGTHEQTMLVLVVILI